MLKGLTGPKAPCPFFSWDQKDTLEERLPQQVHGNAACNSPSQFQQSAFQGFLHLKVVIGASLMFQRGAAASCLHSVSHSPWVSVTLWGLGDKVLLSARPEALPGASAGFCHATSRE